MFPYSSRSKPLPPEVENGSAQHAGQNGCDSFHQIDGVATLRTSHLRFSFRPEFRADRNYPQTEQRQSSEVLAPEKQRSKFQHLATKIHQEK